MCALFGNNYGVMFFTSNVYFATFENHTSDSLLKCFRMCNRGHKVIKHFKILVQVLFTTSIVVHDI